MFEAKDFLDLETLPRAGGLRVQRAPRPGRAGGGERSQARLCGAVPCMRPATAPSTHRESGRFSDEKGRIARLTAGLIEDARRSSWTAVYGGGRSRRAGLEIAAHRTNSLPSPRRWRRGATSN